MKHSKGCYVIRAKGNGVAGDGEIGKRKGETQGGSRSVSSRSHARDWFGYLTLGGLVLVALSGPAAALKQENQLEAATANQQAVVGSMPLATVSRAPSLAVRVQPYSCKHPKDADQESLCIAGSAAKAAWAQAKWSMRTFWIGFAGTFAIAVTLIFTAVAADAARKAAYLAERALVELEKPLVFINFTDPGFVIRPGTPAITFRESLKFEWKNAGRGAAIMTECFECYGIVNAPNLPPTVNVLTATSRILPVGIIVTAENAAKRSRGVFLPEMTNLDDLNKLCKRETFIYFQGFVRYIDVLGNKHRLGFCAPYEPEALEFLVAGGDGYNYYKIEALAERPGRRFGSWGKAIHRMIERLLRMEQGPY